MSEVQIGHNFTIKCISNEKNVTWKFKDKKLENNAR